MLKTKAASYAGGQCAAGHGHASAPQARWDGGAVEAPGGKAAVEAPGGKAAVTPEESLCSSAASSRTRTEMLHPHARTTASKAAAKCGEQMIVSKVFR